MIVPASFFTDDLILRWAGLAYRFGEYDVAAWLDEEVGRRWCLHGHPF